MIRMTHGFRCLAAAGLIFSLAGCGGGSGGSSSTSVQPVDATQHGQFVDAPVAGLNYRTPTHQGLTGAQGQFDYLKGETIQFFIGGLALGNAVPAASIITPVEISGGNRAQGINTSAANIAWLLQSVDSDCDDSNGIQITDATRTATTGSAIDFSLANASFAAAGTPASQLVAQGGPSCRQSQPLSMAAAQSALQMQLAALSAPSTGEPCTAGQWCIGSAKAQISPTDAEVNGQQEARTGGAYSVNQYFHLGGFGFGPFENTKLVEAFVPEFDQRSCVPGDSSTCLSNPPAKRAFHCINAFQPGFTGDCDESQKQRTWLRAFYLSQAGGQQVMFITIDAVGAGNIIMDGMKKAVADATGIPVESVLTGATHSHAAADLQGLWGGVPEDWVRDHLYPAAAAAAVAAKDGARVATLTYATGQEAAFNSYRRPRVDPTATTDHTLSVLQAKDSNGAVLGTLVQYAAHPTAVGESSGGALGRAVFPDYPLGLEDTIEGQTGAPAIYYNGPIADASGSGPTTGSDDYQRTHSRGECLAKSALTLLNPASPQQCSFSTLNLAQTRRVTLSPSFEVHHATAILPVTNPLFAVVAGSESMSHYYDFNPIALSTIPGIGPMLASEQAYLPEAAPTAKTTVSRLTLGGAANGLEIVTIPGESTNTFGQYLRSLAATPNMILLGLTHNSFGYILPEEEFSYIDPSGDAGFVLPFTGYEEFVSLGPLTAPLLRLQAYNPLFNISSNDPRNAPPSVTACTTDSASRACVLQRLFENVDYIQRSYAQQCNENLVANAPAAEKRAAANFCQLINPNTAALATCRDLGLGDGVCDVFGTGSTNPRTDPTVIAAAAEALTRGCDAIDPASCLYPFPSDHFTAPANNGATFKTGKHINFLPQAMPQNTAGKPIDPTEWNRNDGFSPGSMIATVVPGLDSLDALKQTYGFNSLSPDNSVGITNYGLSLQPGTPIEVLEVGASNSVKQHPVWSELDVNAGTLLNLTDIDPIGVTPDQLNDSLPPQIQVLHRPGPYRTSLLVRPAKNFTPGKRYVVVLRNLKDANGMPIKAGPVFQACKAQFNDPTQTVGLPPIDNRCTQLRDSVLPVLRAANVAIDDSLFLAWDFTVASTENTTARLVHMRDEAFHTLANNPSADCSKHNEPAVLPASPDLLPCKAPEFTVDSKTDAGDFWQIEGTVKAPSFLEQGDASPQDASSLQGFFDSLRNGVQNVSNAMSNAAAQCAALPQDQLASGCATLFSTARDGFNSLQDVIPIAQTGNIVENNRLHYKPLDDGNVSAFPAPLNEIYGDGLPDLRVLPTSVTSRYECRIPKAAYDPAAPAYRPSLYGHGLLGDRGEVGAGNVSQFARDEKMMFCAIDWYGFAAGDLPNVAATLLDLSQFPVVPDASQQGFINWMFLARAMQHPAGFISHPEFQKLDGTPVFDRREVFYDGNSQGGILPGPIVAVSKDINRAVFGVPGMNYSTLLRRSVDFTGYSVPLYLSYQNELDRNVAFDLIEMLWDRAENDGYAAYLTPNGRLDGQNNFVLLHPAYGDHQVSMWTPDVMARTIGNVAVDHSRVDAAGWIHHPDVVPYRDIPAVSYVDNKATGSAEVVFVHPSVNNPPIDETPPFTGPDPHSFPRAQVDGQCQKSNFLRSDGFVAKTNGLNATSCVATFGAVPTVAKPGYKTPPPPTNGGLLGLVGNVMSNLNTVLQALASGNFTGAGDGIASLIADAKHDLGVLIFGPNDGTVHITVAHAVDNAGDPADLVGQGGQDLGLVVGLSSDPATTATQSTSANRKVEPVVITGADVPNWSALPATGLPYPYPSGATISGQLYDQFGIIPGQVRNAHNGQLLYPAVGAAVVGGVAVNEIAAFAWHNGWVEIPVQVDEKAPYFLANANSDFSVYSGTDQEVSYVWDNGDPHTRGVESWGMTMGTCNRAYDDNGVNDGPNNGVAAAVPDPVPGLDNDDEIAFMASDAGDLAPLTAKPSGASDGQQIALTDPLTGSLRYVYLFRKSGGSSFTAANGYVKYQRDANADQWIDRSFFADNDPLKIGTSNTGYGPNLSGTVCGDGSPATARNSTDRFPRDGVTVSTSDYQFKATGRWMVREMHIAKPNQPGVYGPDVIDRWKGRAFQQSPDSTISLVGFEDEQVNWEANSSLLGERVGPVRAIREVWGADSGTNVTKTETFYRDAIAYRYHLRVHPIPPDGLYTSWDYNRGAMIPTSTEQGAGVQGGRYFTSLRPQGVPIDGVNDESGNVDSLMGSPAFFDAPDPTFNPPLAIDNWEQVSAKGDLGSLVYTFEIKGITSFVNALVVPYYRDDACLDDGTGDDPVQRPYPGEATTDPRVIAGYATAANKNASQLTCADKQGAYGQHGVHFFFTGDTDNAFSPVTSTEVDGEQWQFLVPTATPQNVGEPYANTVRLPLKTLATPRM